MRSHHSQKSCHATSITETNRLSSGILCVCSDDSSFVAFRSIQNCEDTSLPREEFTPWEILSFMRNFDLFVQWPKKGESERGKKKDLSVRDECDDEMRWDVLARVGYLSELSQPSQFNSNESSRFPAHYSIPFILIFPSLATLLNPRLFHFTNLHAFLLLPALHCRCCCCLVKTLENYLSKEEKSWVGNEKRKGWIMSENLQKVRARAHKNKVGWEEDEIIAFPHSKQSFSFCYSTTHRV